MTHHNTAFHQLLSSVSRHEFESLAKQHHCGQKLRSASRWDQFVGMAMSQLTGQQSLRDIQSNLETQRAKLYHLGAKPIARTTLARLNEKQPAELYQALFYKLLNKCNSSSGSHKFRFKNPLYSLDASAIDLSLKLFPWTAHRDDTANVKLSVGLNHANMVPEFVALSDGNESDMIQGRQFEFPKGSIVAFDKGYVDYQWFGSLTKQGVSFVTRLRPKVVLTQLWIAMITYLLVAFSRHNAKSGWTVQRIIRVLQLNIFERRSLAETLKPDPKRDKRNEPQMRLVL